MRQTFSQKTQDLLTTLAGEGRSVADVRVSSIRIGVLAVATVCAVTPAAGQEPQRERFSVGVVATPALEGGGAWFIPAIRLSGPVRGRIGFDVDGGRVVGGTNALVTITSQYLGRVRFMRGTRSETGNGSYWAVGIQYFPATKVEPNGNRRRRHYTALAVGRGWDYVSPRGFLAINEIGFSGGEGYLVYASIGVGWTPRRANSY